MSVGIWRSMTGHFPIHRSRHSAAVETRGPLTMRGHSCSSSRPNRLRPNLIAVTGGTIALVLLASNYVLISQTQDRVETLVLDQARTEAKAIASDIASNIAELAGAARSMAGVIGRGTKAGISTARASSICSKANVEKNTFAFGSWFAEEPNAFDGKRQRTMRQEGFRRQQGSESSTPYWTKEQDRHRLLDLRFRLSGRMVRTGGQERQGRDSPPYSRDVRRATTTRCPRSPIRSCRTAS